MNIQLFVVRFGCLADCRSERLSSSERMEMDGNDDPHIICNIDGLTFKNNLYLLSGPHLSSIQQPGKRCTFSSTTFSSVQGMLARISMNDSR